MREAVVVDNMADQYFLGRSNLMDEENRITFPPVVERLGIVTTGAEVVWAYDREADAIVVSQESELFEADERYDVIEKSQLGRSHVARYPLAILEEYECWRMSEQVYFVATEAEVQNDIVQIISEDRFEERFSQLVEEE